MEIHYKITTELDPAEQAVTLLLNGKFGEEALPELEQSISAARDARRRIYIDLSEVTLVDRKAVKYFSDQQAQDVKLVNCPVYLSQWIHQGRDDNGK